MKYDPFLYGKDQTEGIISIEMKNIAGESRGVVHTGYETKVVPNEYFILYDQDYTGKMIRLAGNLHYKWAEKFTNIDDYRASVGIAKGKGWDYWTVYNPIESFMIKYGYTYYKGMEPKDLSVLSFDIETTGLNSDKDQVLMISTTYRNKPGKIRRFLHCIDDYKSEKEMIYAWANYVNDCDPHVLIGHNIFGFDLPFLRKRCGSELPIGKLCQNAKFASRPSQFRKDGSQSYDYYNVLVPGREVIDTFHLSIKYDIKRSYPSYKLKEIIKHEGIERKDRQHYDASTIGKVYNIIKNGGTSWEEEEWADSEWKNIKKYAEHDADDSLALFDLMIPAYFYYTQHIPKTLQQVINSATGSQVNSFMVRSYLMEKHSLPKASEPEKYEGGISFGNPGIYQHVVKFDVASLYPSIILDSGIYDENKDPKANFLKMVEHFTKERLENKRMYKETGDRKYKDLSEAQKIVINSAYGFMGAPGLLFNSPQNAALVTKRGRDILYKGIQFAIKGDMKIVNADTDSFSFTDGEKWNKEDIDECLEALNEGFPEKIVWEDDGYYDKFVVVKAKNYIMLKNKAWLTKDENPLTIKGSALKATMKEPALKNFIGDIIKTILNGKVKYANLYKFYVRDILNISMDTIANWCSKKTITKAVLQPKRTNEQRIFDAIKGKRVQEGDKIHVFFEDEKTLRCKEDFNGIYAKKKLLGKLFNTAKIFESILDMKDFPNLTLKRNLKILQEIEKGPQSKGDIRKGA